MKDAMHVALVALLATPLALIPAERAALQGLSDLLAIREPA